SEKLSAMGALLAGVAHELNNPLAILMGRSALLQRKALDPAVQADALKIHAAADRCGRIVRTFLSMARQRPAQRRIVQLADVAAGAVDLVGYNLRSSGIEVEQRFAPGLPALEIDADQIGQVLVNLLVNAQQALSSQPEPRRVALQARHSGEQVTLRVADNGPGVPAALRERIFDPFFTTKAEGAGTGVGLSVSRAIAREHGGELRLVASDVGACFELELPLGAGAAEPAAAGDETRARMLPAGTALVVDDEPEVAQVLCDVLRSAGCTAVAVASGREALAWLDQHECSFILCDIRMPDLDGPALWRALQQRHPQMLGHLAFITGDTLSASVAPFLRETGLPSLDKPFTPEEVLELVARIERL
ncbi:MAG TPA: ATP-binding protein, partial [Ramlibacter sp.]|nr:ATP-binding protein [Ramlibacter sp.]